MNYNAGLKSVLLSSSALILLAALTGNAGAQNITISGDNAQVYNPCRISGEPDPIVTAPEPCTTVEYTPQDPYSDSSFTSSGNWQRGIIIGKDGNGEVRITSGGTASTAHLVVGHEENASGSVIISGAGSEYVNHSSTAVGNAGSGELIIHDGGVYRQVNHDYFNTGYGETGNGYVEVSGVAASGQRSSLITRGRIYVGNYGNATMNILDGGLVSAEYTSFIGAQLNSNSSMLVSGVNAATGHASKFEVLHNQLWIGDFGHGSISILDGGLVQVADGFQLGGEAEGVGFLNLDGFNESTGTRSTVKANIFRLGLNGKATAYITGGSTVNTNFFHVAIIEGSEGTLVISGEHKPLNYRSSIYASETGHIGYNGKADVTINDGGLIDIGGNLGIGYNIYGNGIVNLYGENSHLVASGNTYLGEQGEGTLNLIDGGNFNTEQLIIARQTSGRGVINVGVGGLSGVVNTTSIHGGRGDATINFNHIDDINFAPVMEGNLKVNQVNTGATTLTSTSSYSGLTTISAGALRAGLANAFSVNSDYLVDEFGTLDLNGFDQALANLDNAGLVRFGGNGGATLDISDTYTGAGGLIEFNTVLHDDTSLTDRLVAQQTTGTSFVRVINAGGTGAQTNDGIRLIEVSDPSFSLGTFSLLGDYVFEGDQAVVGGAYAYRLYQGATSAPDDGNWYLRSALIPTDPDTPLYQPGVPVYESYAQSLLGLNGLNTLQQRVGNRFWAGNGNRVIAQGADMPQYYAPTEESGPYTDGNGIWGRIEGAHNKVDPKLSTSGADYSQNVFKMQAGVDMLLSENMDGMLIGGVFAHYTHGKTKVRSIYGDGTISTDGYGFGGSLTWYGNEGFYVDGQAQATWYNSDLASTLASTGLVSGNKGFGYALSLETGKRFAITPEWSLTPQAQLTYSNVDFDSFRDVWNTHVSLDRGSRLEGRLGLSLDHEASWQNAAGMTDRAHVYGIANLYYGFTEGTRVNVANTQFHQEQERLWGGLGIGGSYNWNDDKYSLYGEGLINTSLNSFGDSYTLKGNVGFRVKW